MQLVYKFIPLSVVRGVQLAQGLSFALTAVKYIKKVQNLPKSKAMGERHWLGLDGLVLAIVCLCFIVIVNGAGVDVSEGGVEDEEQSPSRKNSKKRWRRIMASLPSAFMIFVLGVILAFIRKPKIVHEIKFGPSPIEVVKISRHAWKDGFIKGAIPQLPLSILNSVIAVCKLSSDLFPEKDFSPSSISITVGMMNVVGSWFGAMPSCHGAGGLAGQYKFGGRSVGVLGVLLLFAGIEVAMCARDMNTKEESFVMLICTAVSLVGSSAALGFVVGMGAYVLLWLRKLGCNEKPNSIINLDA
ncbi:hypothetical protein ACLB2K_017401 [Fragaria x ananassa]